MAEHTPHIIGITGPAGAGKSTFARHLLCALAERHIPAICIPFAAALKKLARSIGWDGVKDARGRRLLQLLGTDVCRGCISDSYWIDRWRAAVVRAAETHVHVVVTDDVRFPNEAFAIRALNGTIIRLTGRAADIGAGARHASEIQLRASLVDVAFDNRGSTAMLQDYAASTAACIVTALGAHRSRTPPQKHESGSRP